MQHCTYKLLSWDLHTLQLQKCMYFAHLIVLLLQELKEVSTPSPPSSNMEMQQRQRKGKEQRPPHQIRHPLPLSGSFCPFCHEQLLRQQHLLQADMEVPFPSGQIPAVPSSSWTSPASWCGPFTYFKSWNHPPCRDHMRTLQHSQEHDKYLANPQSCALAVTRQFSLLLAMTTTQTSLTFPDWHLHSLALSDQAEHLALWSVCLELRGCNWVNWERQPGEDSQVLKRGIQCEVEIQTTALSGRAFSGWS